MDHSYYELQYDEAYIQQMRNEDIHRYNEKMQRYDKIAKATGFKYTGYLYHMRSVDSVTYDVFIKHDDNGYHFAYLEHADNSLKVILTNQKELLKMYQIGDGGKIYESFDYFLHRGRRTV